MTLKIDKNSSSKDTQKKILRLVNKHRKLKTQTKKELVEKSFGKVLFDPKKSALEIQKEMRDEWD